jgi:hypothetical protein
MNILRMPQLIIGYESNSYPSTAVCSACGEEIQKGELTGVSAEDNVRWFLACFSLHLRDKHPEVEANAEKPFETVQLS